ncbi:GNAT family N-acetyltransferase [Acidaminobacter sp. JC074]|uniref:GNAT family N-acetyltransferase n=1 Tax=Acidaminobacter sp. JC074 TaxID=2530199 RepID=UPI001F111D1A|nr:GNAT family N-acetyltransferase [Acidaminobacter sp. JC074]MCH4886823.1 GNAT family N-acetyltransferase [Acidaminobacter sp. JC074]
MNINNEFIGIRNIVREDMDFIQKLWGDEESMLASGGPYMIRDEDKDDLFTILNKGQAISNHYMISVGDQLIGDLSIRDHSDDKAQLDMKIMNDERNKGYGKQALSLILDYFFNELGGKEVYFELWLVNYFANKKLKDYGFEATSVTEDYNVMTLTRENYQESALKR